VVSAKCRELFSKTYWNGTPGSKQFATPAQVLSVVSQAIELFSHQPTLLNLTSQFTVVGDIHDHFFSLLRIFHKLGWPDSHHYLFLGDYVDRGKCSCEVLVLLSCFKVLFPHSAVTQVIPSKTEIRERQ
jgi:hypothetical protein